MVVEEVVVAVEVDMVEVENTEVHMVVEEEVVVVVVVDMAED